MEGNKSMIDKEQYVRVNNETSQFKGINIGVPQGTVWGPLVYTSGQTQFGNKQSLSGLPPTS